MIIYHGSYIEVAEPDITHSRKNVDFGVGFYTTPIYEQAQKWCRKFKDRGRESVISVYEFDDGAFEKFKSLRFDSYSEEWLDFIVSCRRSEDKTDYDIVMGGVANDKVFNTVELFFDGLINKAEAIGRLKYEKPNYQVVLRSQKVIDEALTFERSEKL